MCFYTQCETSRVSDSAGLALKVCLPRSYYYFVFVSALRHELGRISRSEVVSKCRSSCQSADTKTNKINNFVEDIP